MTRYIFYLILLINLSFAFCNGTYAQPIIKYINTEAHVTTVFNPYLLSNQQDILKQTWYKDAISTFQELVVPKIPVDSLGELLLNRAMLIGLDNTKNWYFTSQRMHNGITHYMLSIPPFKVADFLAFIQKNTSLFQPTDIKFYKSKFFYIIKDNTLISWSKDHISIQKFILPNPQDYKAFPIQNISYIDSIILPTLYNENNEFSALKKQCINQYNMLSVHLKYKQEDLSLGLEFFEKGNKAILHCSQTNPNALLNILGFVPASKIYFTLSEKMPFYNLYPALKQLKNKQILLQVKDANNFDISMAISSQEMLQLIDSFYTLK